MPEIYEILKYPAPILSAPADSVTEFDGVLRELVADMFATMYAARGVGLAAPQIGINKRLAVIDLSGNADPARRIVLVNPYLHEITESAAGQQTAEEGCLSLPGFRETVTRPNIVWCDAANEHGDRRMVEGKGLLARALCHEIDHLAGILFFQRATVNRAMWKRLERWEADQELLITNSDIEGKGV